MKNIIVFEDNNFSNLAPLSINHASFELKCGLYTNLDRIIKYFDDANIILIVRSDLKDLLKERYPSYDVNPTIIPSGTYINGSAIINKVNFNLLLTLKGLLSLA